MVNNNTFVIYGQNKEMNRWRCSWYAKTHCKCKLQTFGQAVRIIDRHNHDPTCPKPSGSTKKVEIIYASDEHEKKRK